MSRILVIEDDVLIGNSLVKGLRDEGLEVDLVGDGYGAINRLHTNQYDAVVLDLIIHSGLNGFGVLNFIELEQPRLLDRVFLATSMPDQTVMRMAPLLLSRYYRKPYDKGKLIAHVADSVRRTPGSAHVDAGTRVLIVEDDAMSAELLATLTREMGYQAEMAVNGREAITKLTADKFQAVVLDLVMPEIDGFSVLEFLKGRQPDVIRCTIVVSGLPERYRQELKQYDLPAELEKPVDTDRFREILKRCASSGG
jgi:CheY-like chemotaxis protein